MARRNSLVGEADVGVTDPAPCHLDQHLARPRLEWTEIYSLQGTTDRGEAVAESILNGNHVPSLPPKGLSLHLQTAQRPFSSSCRS